MCTSRSVLVVETRNSSDAQMQHRVKRLQNTLNVCSFPVSNTYENLLKKL